MAWLANLRVRYALVQKGGLNVSIFGGLGYGHIKYRVKGSDVNGDGKEDPYFPIPGMFNIELGPGLAYYFNRHVGIFAEVPIDLLVGDGWALNFDVNVGLSFGF